MRQVACRGRRGKCSIVGIGIGKCSSLIALIKGLLSIPIKTMLLYGNS